MDDGTNGWKASFRPRRPLIYKIIVFYFISVLLVVSSLLCSLVTCVLTLLFAFLLLVNGFPSGPFFSLYMVFVL